MLPSIRRDAHKFLGLLCVMFVCLPVQAQESKPPEKKPHAPPSKMTAEQKRQAIAASCRKEAQALNLKGEPLKQFMKSCRDEPPRMD
jgi:psiF repeat